MNVYDFDKTIYNGDSTFDFYIFCLKKHKNILSLAPSLFCAFVKYYIFKKGTKTEFKQKMYRFLTKCDAEKETLLFWDKNHKKIKIFYIVQQTADDVIISASPEFLLSPICKRLGINHLIASRVNSSNGVYTGINCHGEEKVKRFYEAFGSKAKIDEFYSDSKSDTPLAKAAEKAFIVDGDKISEWKFD